MGDDGTDDETLTSTIEEQLADEGTGGNTGANTYDGEQTQALSQEDLMEAQAAEQPSDDALAEENAETSLDQPSDSSS